MKLVRGIVREDKVSEVVQALERVGASGLTVTRVHGRGAETHSGIHRGLPYPVLLPMCAIEVIASDNTADDIARVMVDGAHTGHKGDGHVFILALDESCAIRTRWPSVA
jgi:nitrogen regulatory protein PII